jgi:acetyltransferase-like isoleucine patch superfamily enzyme
MRPEPATEVLSATFGDRHERLEEHPSPGEHNALWHWAKTVPRRRVYRNYILMRLARATPSLSMKNWLYRRMGMKVGDHVSVGLEATMDIFFPDLITLEAEAIIGYGTTILAHEYMQRQYRTGPVVVGRGAVVGAKCLILPGVKIAPGAVVSAFSLVNRDVEGFVGGVPVRRLKKRAAEPREETPHRA